MAIVYGEQYQDAYVDVPSSAIRKGDLNANPRFMYFSYSAAGALALNDVIKLGKIPAGARIIEACISASDLGTTGTLDLGWAASADGLEAADDNGFINAMNVNSAADTIMMSDNLANGAGMLKLFSSEVDLQIKVSAATDAAGVIKGYILYSLV